MSATDGEFLSEFTMQLADLCADYVANNERVQSPETRRLLRVVIRNFEKFLRREGVAADLTDEQIKHFGMARRAAGLALSTIDGELSKLMAIKRYAADRGLTPRPMLRIAKSQSPTPVAFLRWQIRRLWREAQRSKATIGGVPGSLYWPSLLDLLWDSGERIRAIYRLDRRDIDLRGRWVTFRERKGQGAVLVKRIRRKTAKQLRKLMQSNTEDRLFSVVCLGTIYHQYETLLTDAGLPTDRHSKFHCLRKSHASYLHLAGGDSRASLGHATEAVTIKHYHDVKITGSKQAIDYLFSPFCWWDRLLALVGL